MTQDEELIKQFNKYRKAQLKSDLLFAKEMYRVKDIIENKYREEKK
jgi:hypothetical protein